MKERTKKALPPDNAHKVGNGFVSAINTYYE